MTNLNAEDDLNTLTLEARQDIWVPEVIFYNTEIKTETLNDEKAFATVYRNATYQRTNESYLHNSYLYQGNENPITLTRVYSGKFICDYDMSVYPFDTQKCSAIFIMKGNAGNFVKLLSKRASYLGPIDLPQYYIIKTIIQNDVVPPNINAVKVDVIFGRRILSTFLSSYLPTFLICLMVFATNYFKGFFFEAIVTVNLTSLLALTTLFVSIMNSLPKTSYIKMMDVWLIFCLTIPFCEVILQVRASFNHLSIQPTYIDCWTDSDLHRVPPQGYYTDQPPWNGYAKAAAEQKCKRQSSKWEEQKFDYKCIQRVSFLGIKYHDSTHEIIPKNIAQM